MASINLAGVFPPIPTPFDASGDVACDALLSNLAHLNRSALAGFVVLGSNGEAVHLNDSETLQVIETARVGIPPDRLMIVGTGRLSTGETALWTRRAAEAGADAALVLPPYYYRGQMTTEVLVQHFRAIADEAPIPIILYNMPACTGIDLGAETVLVLASHENICGIKDSGGNLAKLAEIRKDAGPNFAVLAGSAGFLLPALAVGASGGVVALANIAPEPCLRIVEAARCGDWKTAREIQLRMIRPNTAVTRGWGVPALKAAMDLLGLFGGEPRAPLLPLSDARKSELRRMLEEADILQP